MEIRVSLRLTRCSAFDLLVERVISRGRTKLVSKDQGRGMVICSWSRDGGKTRIRMQEREGKSSVKGTGREKRKRKVALCVVKVLV